MARPTSKEMLLEQSAAEYEKLNQLIDSLTANEQEALFLFENRDRNIRDVMAHLLEWQLMMIKWYKIGMTGEKPEIPAKGYTWKTTPALNAVIWEKYQLTSLADVRDALAITQKEITSLIEKHSNDELFTKKYYKWTNTTSLGAFFISATSSHFDWALKKIRKQIKLLKSKK